MFCEGRRRIPPARAEHAIGCHSFMPEVEGSGGDCHDYYDPVSMAKCSTRFRHKSKYLTKTQM